MTTFDEDIEAVAADWAVRGMGDAISEADIRALTQWLDASPRHVEAYRRAIAVWVSVDLSAEANLNDDMVRPTPKAHRASTLAWLGGGGFVMAAGLVVAVAIINSAATETYETPKGGRQTIILADGTRLMLNTDTRVVAKIDKSNRILTLEKGEVALEVVHDEKKPFIVKTGDLAITDVGTQFNVSRLEGVVRVHVREGEVALKAGAATKNLRPGDLGIHNEATGENSFTKSDPNEAFAWQSAHAIYHDQPLSAVVKDINRYFSKPIRVDAAAARLNTNLILTLDSPTAVAGRLSELLPLDVRTTNDAIYLSRRADAASAGSQ